MKKIITISTIFVLLLTLISIQTCIKKQTDVIQIGAILPLTGYLSDLGNDEKIGIQLALQERSTDNIKVVFEDSKSDAKNALTAARRLITSGVNKIILSTTPSVLTVLPAYKNNKDLFFVAQCQAVSVLDGYTNAIRVYMTVENETTILADFVNKRKYKKIMAFHINNDAGVKALNEFIAKIGVSAVEIAAETFEFSDKDYKTQLLKIKNSNPEVIFIFSYPTQWINIIKQLSEIDFNKPIIGNSSYSFIAETPEMQKLKITENIIFPAPKYVLKSKDKNAIAFKEKFKSQYNKDANYDILYFYDLINILADNIKYANNNEIFLNKIVSNEYEGMTGKIKFNDKNDVLPIDVKLVSIANGEYQSIEE